MANNKTGSSISEAKLKELRTKVNAAAKQKNVSVPKSALDNFVDTYKKTKVGPIQRAIGRFIDGVDMKADYTSGKSSYAKANTEAQANRAKSSGGRSAAQSKATQIERDQQKLAAKSKAAGGKPVMSRKTATANIKSVPKAKNYNVGVSKGGVSFKEAFAHFRKKGSKTFTWNGTKYTTELKKKK
tara:strand:- start:831 stop:1385 length:555 start_codon:yes stop_codon:yes gene_type:complete